MFNLLQLLLVGCGYVVSALGLRWGMRFLMDSSIMVVAKFFSHDEVFLKKKKKIFLNYFSFLLLVSQGVVS